MEKKTAGFTLVELMIVIVILGVLIGIAVPNMAGMLGTADDAEIETELEMMRNAINMYRNSEGSYPSTSGDLRDLEEFGLSEEIVNKFNSVGSGGEYTYNDSPSGGLHYEVTHDDTTWRLDNDNGVQPN